LKKTAAESYRLLGEAYDEHAPSQKTYERDFSFKIGDFDVADKETKKYEDVKLHCWMKMIHKHKNNSQSN